MQMADAGVAAATDFDWASQMRFYWRGDNETGHLKVPYVITLQYLTPNRRRFPVLAFFQMCVLVNKVETMTFRCAKPCTRNTFGLRVFFSSIIAKVKEMLRSNKSKTVLR